MLQTAYHQNLQHFFKRIVSSKTRFQSIQLLTALVNVANSVALKSTLSKGEIRKGSNLRCKVLEAFSGIGPFSRAIHASRSI